MTLIMSDKFIFSIWYLLLLCSTAWKSVPMSLGSNATVHILLIPACATSDEWYWFQHVPLQMNDSCILWRNGRPLKDPLSKIEQNGTHIVNFINMEVSYSNVKWILTSKGQSNQNWYFFIKKNCICPSHRNFYFIFQWFHVIKTLVFFFETIMAVGKKMRIHKSIERRKRKGM